ncbi:MAG: shikimate dehydrogenase, partial [Gammaproteobacteria bacterium]|nr:shikimate dehydrogenase [Gammaproteobacteria bacterium]
MLTGAAKVAGIMGWPVSHSRSPAIHGHWLARYGIDGAYIPYSVRPEHGYEAIRMLPRLGFSGTNVTLPHKETALRAVDETDPVARRIGAVNTVVAREDGSLHGSNTDAYGFLEHLRASAPDWRPGVAVVLGAGGSARAVAAALV